MKQRLFVLFVLGVAAHANAGAVIELVPNDPGPYFPGESVSVEVWLHNGDAVGRDLRLVGLDVRGLRDRLCAGGDFAASGTDTVNHVAKLSGGSWVPLGPGTEGPVYALEACTYGVADALYVGGRIWGAFDWEATVNGWDGHAWSEVGRASSGRVLSLLCWNDGSGDQLYAGGYIWEMEGIPAYNIAKWNGDEWSAMQSLNGSVRDMAIFDDGTGPALYVAGSFPRPMPPDSGTTLHYVAKWMGTGWAPLGGGVMFGYYEWAVNALAAFDDGTGLALYAGGDFRHIYLPETNDLMQVNNIARWNGTAWSTVGGGTTPNVAAPINDMVVFDDGGGSALYVGGEFATAGGVSANNIARWDGIAWSDVGDGVTGGMDTAVHTLFVFDDGSGPALYAGGQFSTAGGLPVSNVAKWDGVNWSLVGDGFDDTVRALTVWEATGDPNLTMDPLFQFDFSTLSDGGAEYLTFPQLPGPGIIYSGSSPVSGSILHLASSGSLRVGTMDVTMPDTLGTYSLDVVSPYGQFGGALLMFGFGDPDDPFTVWSAKTGELTGETYPFAVVPPDPPTVPAGEQGYAKNRYLALLPANAGDQTALRVTLTDSLLFPEATGSHWWVGPPAEVSENSGSVDPIQGWPNFMAARMQCTPYYADWDAAPGSGVPVHVYGPEVVPDANYEVEAIHEASDIGDQESFSTPLVVPTAKWGDIVVNCSTCPCGAPNGSVDISDVVAVLDKFQNANCAPIKARCDLDPELVNRVISITDATRVIDAFSGVPYPFGAPIPCP